MVEVELFIQWVFTGYSVDPVSTVLVSKSTFDLASLKKLSPKMRGWGGANDDDTMIAGVGLTFQSKSMSTWTVWTVPSGVNISPLAPRRL